MAHTRFNLVGCFLVEGVKNILGLFSLLVDNGRLDYHKVSPPTFLRHISRWGILLPERKRADKLRASDHIDNAYIQYVKTPGQINVSHGNMDSNGLYHAFRFQKLCPREFVVCLKAEQIFCFHATLFRSLNPSTSKRYEYEGKARC